MAYVSRQKNTNWKKVGAGGQKFGTKIGRSRIQSRRLTKPPRMAELSLFLPYEAALVAGQTTVWPD